MTEAPARKRFKVLFLCTGNSARSILAEFFLRRLDPVRFEAFSAGADPRGRVNPDVLEILSSDYHIDVSSARSKSWEEFRGIRFDFVITVCDRARESCPVWPGQPIVAHWGSEDPDAVEGEEARRRAVKNVAVEVYRRLQLFTALPIESLDRLRLEELTRRIGTGGAESTDSFAAASAPSKSESPVR
jgi:arsenate reductase